MYIADSANHRVRKISALLSSTVTIAGTGAASFSGDGGPATSAAVYYPVALALDSSGTMMRIISLLSHS